MIVLALNISDKKYNYCKFNLENDKVEKVNAREKNCFKTKNKIKKVQLDSAFVNYLIRELMISEFYRVHFIQKWTAGHNATLILVLNCTKYDLIDYNWNDIVYVMVRERCELDHALSWLSTLGGAFSALGDYFPLCADTAGKISIHQLKLALRMGDPNTAARCRLYLSLSLIQKKKFRYAERIIYREYQLARKATVIDSRLLNMCRGIWSKLQYEFDVFTRTKAGLSEKMRKAVI
ncbi:uncharacterized protein F58A4.6 [Anoplophora glabripennis]|uniref:uncharacterized protein F58A4.6 n=1 Tax=Anoplophora glabripennis TaxID=217634 RepID=UPI0008745228|nr:uncharacterized protein F58A4.6 [Anoplophora glabripennis]